VVYSRSNGGSEYGSFTQSSWAATQSNFYKNIADEILKGLYAEGVKLYNSASGNLFGTPSLTTIAENGPEIVLNPTDTENLLRAVAMLRQIPSVSLSSVGINGDSGATAVATQTVTINADFPNVSARDEIQEAFNNLLNQAAQYASRRY